MFKLDLLNWITQNSGVYPFCQFCMRIICFYNHIL